jgi:hypothetical protein
VLNAQDDDLVMNLVDLVVLQPPDVREAWLREACHGPPRVNSIHSCLVNPITACQPLNRTYAECRIMPSLVGERQWGGCRIAVLLGIIRAPTGKPGVRRLA